MLYSDFLSFYPVFFFWSRISSTSYSATFSTQQFIKYQISKTGYTSWGVRHHTLLFRSSVLVLVYITMQILMHSNWFLPIRKYILRKGVFWWRGFIKIWKILFRVWMDSVDGWIGLLKLIKSIIKLKTHGISMIWFPILLLLYNQHGINKKSHVKQYNGLLLIITT